VRARSGESQKETEHNFQQSADAAIPLGRGNNFEKK